MMKKINILLVLVFISVASQAFTQNYIEKDGYDDMLETRTLSTKWVKIYQDFSYIYNIRLRRAGSNNLLDLKIMERSLLKESISEDLLLIVKFTDGEILKLKSRKMVFGGPGKGAVSFSGSGAPGINPAYQLSEEALKKLANKTINKIRVYLSEKYIEEILKPKNSTKFKVSASQFLEKL